MAETASVSVLRGRSLPFPLGLSLCSRASQTYTHIESTGDLVSTVLDLSQVSRYPGWFWSAFCFSAAAIGYNANVGRLCTQDSLVTLWKWVHLPLPSFVGGCKLAAIYFDVTLILYFVIMCLNDDFKAFGFVCSGFVQWYFRFGMSALIYGFIIIFSLYYKILIRKSLFPNTLFP